MHTHLQSGFFPRPENSAACLNADDSQFFLNIRVAVISAKKTQAPTPQAPIRNRQTRKVANAKVRHRYTNLTYIMRPRALY